MELSTSGLHGLVTTSKTAIGSSRKWSSLEMMEPLMITTTDK